MNTPNITFYGIFEDVTIGKTPKYRLNHYCGYYPPMEKLQGKDGFVSVNLMEKLKEGERVPAMRLQGKNGINLTGLKDYFVEGQLTGYAYGNPPTGETFSAKQKPNPFFGGYEDDCFLFRYDVPKQTNTDEPVRPVKFEFVVLSGAKCLGSSYCNMLRMGGFDDVLTGLQNTLISPVSQNG